MAKNIDFQKLAELLVEINEQFSDLSDSDLKTDPLQLELLEATASYFAANVAVYRRSIEQGFTFEQVADVSDDASLQESKIVEEQQVPLVDILEATPFKEENPIIPQEIVSELAVEEKIESDPYSDEKTDNEPITSSIISEIPAPPTPEVKFDFEKIDFSDAADKEPKEEEHFTKSPLESFQFENSSQVEENALEKPSESVESVEDVFSEIDVNVDSTMIDNSRLNDLSVTEAEKHVELPGKISYTTESEDEKQPLAEPSRPLTLNEIIANQQKQNVSNHSTTEKSDFNRIVDLKTSISLNDKLLFIKDLFNGYSLAYSEAIEILNRFDDFASADAFLQANYYLKNNWNAKPETVEKLYSILNKKYNN